jgi:hypothetical protein
MIEMEKQKISEKRIIMCERCKKSKGVLTLGMFILCESCFDYFVRHEKTINTTVRHEKTINTKKEEKK